jgi:hypothetical protein
MIDHPYISSQTRPCGVRQRPHHHRRPLRIFQLRLTHSCLQAVLKLTVCERGRRCTQEALNNNWNKFPVALTMVSLSLHKKRDRRRDVSFSKHAAENLIDHGNSLDQTWCLLCSASHMPVGHLYRTFFSLTPARAHRLGLIPGYFIRTSCKTMAFGIPMQMLYD